MSRTEGSPFAPHTASETEEMLSAIGADDEEALFDIPESVRFDGEFDIDRRSEREIRGEIDRMLGENADLTEFLGRGHYDHYVPSLVDHLADRQEYLTSYTQYQPELTQGFLQVLFEYQSMLVELTGLEVANCSMHDAATALGEAATLADRVRGTSGHRILVPELIREGRRSVLENYADGAGLTVETYPTDDANADTDALADLVDEDVVMLYAENPTVRGTIEENLDELGVLTDENDAMFVLGTDPVALSVLTRPADVGVDVVVGDAATLGMPTSYGMGLGLFATREEFLRQVPGRLVGASEDSAGKRAYTLTLQTREQHIRRERATSNICTNQAWVALRTAMHAASLGASGLVELATDCLTLPSELAERVNGIEGIEAPVHDRHHFREFVARTDRSAHEVREELEERGFAIHALDEDHLQICVTETNTEAVDDLVAALEEVTA
jgi:glycine dehydrogenase subunit 1